MALLLLLVIAGVSAFAAGDSSWEDQLHAGQQLKQQGRFQEASHVFTELLRKVEQAGADTAEVALTLVNLADVDAALGREWEANGEYERGLSILERQNGPDDELVVLLVHRLGRLNVQMCRYPKAEALLKRAIAAREKAAPVNRRQLAAALRDLAVSYLMQRDADKAEPIIRRALEILEGDTGRHEVQMAGTLNPLAWVMLATRRYAEGIEYAERSLRLLQAVNPPAASLGDTSLTLGILYLCADRLDDASHSLKTAIDHSQLNQWDDKFRLQSALRAYAAVLRRQKHGGEAKSAEKRAREIQAETGRAQATVDISTFLPRSR